MQYARFKDEAQRDRTALEGKESRLDILCLLRG